MPKRNDRGPSVEGACPPNLALAIIGTFVAMLWHPIQTWRIIRDGE